MNKAILIALVATVIVIGGVAAYFYLEGGDEELRDVDYYVSAYCYTPGYSTLIITLHSYQDEITEGDLLIYPSTTPYTHLTFIDGVATLTEEDEESTEVGPLRPATEVNVKIPGFNAHRVDMLLHR